MDVTTAYVGDLNIEYNTINISTFLDFIKFPFDELKSFRGSDKNYDLINYITFLDAICDKYLPKISSLLKDNSELSDTLFYDFMDCWAMINHILNTIKNLITKNEKIMKKDFEYILNSLKFINNILNDLSNILNCKILDFSNDSKNYEEKYKQYQSKLEKQNKIFNNKYYNGLKEPNKNMKRLLATEFIENEFK